MSVHKRGEVYHYEFVINGHRYRGSTKKTGVKAARQFEAEERARQSSPVGAVARETLTLDAVARRWFAARQADKKSATTVAIRLEIALRLLGRETPIDAIDAPEIEEAMLKRRKETTRQGKTPSNSTINRDLIDTTLRPIMTYAKKVLKQPVADVEWKELRLSEPKGRDRTFTAAEIAAWRDALPAHHQPIFDFASRYGVRLQEAFFPLDCVDAEAGRINLRDRKNGRGHSLRLLPEDHKTIASLYSRASGARLATLWFREMATGQLRPVHWRGFQSASQAALKKAGIADARPVHDLRHHAGTTLVRHTGNLSAAKALLGHDNIQSTMRYVRADDDDVFDAMSKAHTTRSPTKRLREDAKPLVSSTATGT